MAAEIDFFQIYYRDDQLPELYPFAIPYKNENLTLYFENSVISELVPKSDAKRISVCSWRLKQKRGGLFRVDKNLKYEELLDDYDVAILTPRSPAHKPLRMAGVWHGKAWDNALRELRSFIKIPKELKHSIYENHFVATRDVYHRYVNECLNPCLSFMSSRPVFFADSNYNTRKMAEERTAYKNLTGRNDWPMAPFVLERLFSIWVDSQDLKIVKK